jgi:hypothetical protein
MAFYLFVQFAKVNAFILPHIFTRVLGRSDLVLPKSSVKDNNYYGKLYGG